MTSLERIMAAVTGSDADYQPFTMLLSLYGSSLINCDTTEYYKNPVLWFEGQKAVVDTINPDILITPFSFPLEAEAFGSEMIFLHKYAPNVRKPIITDLSQIKDIRLPDLGINSSIQFFLQGTSMLVNGYKSTKAIASVLHSPCDIPSLLMGIEMWIDTLLFYPKEVDAILKKTTEHFVNLGNEYLSRGATFLVIPVNFTNPLMITDHIYEKLKPYLENAFSQIKGPIVVHNGGCTVMPFISKFAQLPNVIAIVLDPRESFDKAREIIGDKMVLMGNFDGPNFVNLNPEKANSIALKILENRKNDKHFIFATSNADIPYDTSVETLKAVAKTIRAFKKY